jgi:hypothetical protein
MNHQSVPVPFKESICVTSLLARSRIHAMTAGKVHLWANMIVVEAGDVVAEMGLDDVDRINVDGRKVYDAED